MAEADDRHRNRNHRESPGFSFYSVTTECLKFKSVERDENDCVLYTEKLPEMPSVLDIYPVVVL